MVRRDWCPLSKRVGNKVLEEILSGKDREKIIMVLNDFFTDISQKMKNNDINVAEFIITKQLTKSPSEYSDFKSLPHVAVANRQKAKGKTDTELVGNFIPFVICIDTKQEIDSKAGLAAKAFHPQELMD